jgi:hypothetical protein
MKYDDIKGKIKKYNVVELTSKINYEKKKYLVVSLSKDIMKIVSLLEENGTVAVSPILAISYPLISEVKKLDVSNLLFYIEANNIHVNNAIEFSRKYFKNKGTKEKNAKV